MNLKGKSPFLAISPTVCQNIQQSGPAEQLPAEGLAWRRFLQWRRFATPARKLENPDAETHIVRG
jgi:hypothetical protein